LKSPTAANHPAQMTDILQKICADKLSHVEERKKAVSLDELQRKIKTAPSPRGFLTALKAKKIALIAEIKKASPSGGIIRADFDPVAIAKAYESAGATCISVLTDEKYFSGHDEYVALAKNACSLPVLRKDFMLDPYQIYESLSLGADCILLIIAALKTPEAKELEAIALGLGMDVLIEVHDEKELETALTLKSKLIGINNRNLKTLRVDMNTALTLAKKIPPSYTAVCESGIKTNADIKLMAENGVNCFLVGESLMRQPDIATATRNLLNP